MKLVRQVFVVISVMMLLGIVRPVVADNMMMVRTTQTFPEAMAELQNLIRKQGYTVSRVQRVDIGLTKSGYKTDKYRVVFYGKPEQIRELSRRYPDLVAYLPLKISIFAEDRDTILVSANPQHLKRAGDAKLSKIIDVWEQDLAAIFRTLGEQNQ